MPQGPPRSTSQGGKSGFKGQSKSAGGKSVGKGGKAGGKSSGKGVKKGGGKAGGAAPGSVGGKAASTGKAAGRGKGSSDGLTRKQRQKTVKGKGTGKGKGKGAGGEQSSKKNFDAGNGAAGGEGKKRKRIKFLGKKKNVSTAPAMPAPMCRNSHKMESKSENPKGYQNIACCDVCGKENLPMKSKSFFHCSFCRFDLCVQCAAEWRPGDPKKDADTPEKVRKKRLREAAEAGTPSIKKGKGQGDVDKAKQPTEFNRARRETWLPTDSEAVSRAPVQVSVMSDWIEGVPV